jgi:hypothetical protein
MKKLIMLALLFIHSHAYADTVTIDFDLLPAGAIITDQFASQGVLISSSFGDVTIFSGCCSESGLNSLDGGNFREVIVTFVDPADVLRPATTDYFRMTLGDVDLPGNGMTAYDIDGNQIAQVISSCVAAFDCPGDSFLETLSLSATGMHRIVIAAGGQLANVDAQSEATVDTFVFNAVVAQVPEASRTHTLAAGLLLISLIALRRSRGGLIGQRNRRD